MRNCPVCTFEIRDVLYVTPSAQRVNCCDSCGMVYSDNSAPVDYAADSIYTCAQTYDGQPEHYGRIVRNIIECGVPVRSSVLDVGCALGGLIQAFQESWFKDVRGISLSQGEVDACIAKGLRAEVCDIAQADPADLVALSHVLEHVPDVMPFLKNLRSAARNFIYIEVPDALRYSRFFTSACQGFNAEHINHFSLSHLMLACLNAGMEIYAQGSYDMAVGGDRRYPAIWVMAKPTVSTLRKNILSYSVLLDKQIHPLDSLLRQLRLEHLAIWGVGQTAQMFLASGALTPSKIVAATDTNPAFHGKRFGACEIVAPESFNPPSNVPILVCSQLSKNAIVQRIKELGLANKIITLESE